MTPLSLGGWGVMGDGLETESGGRRTCRECRSLRGDGKGRSVNGERGSGVVGGLPVADEYFGDRVTLGQVSM